MNVDHPPTPISLTMSQSSTDSFFDHHVLELRTDSFSIITYLNFGRPDGAQNHPTTIGSHPRTTSGNQTADPSSCPRRCSDAGPSSLQRRGLGDFHFLLAFIAFVAAATLVFVALFIAFVALFIAVFAFLAFVALFIAFIAMAATRDS